MTSWSPPLNPHTAAPNLAGDLGRHQGRDLGEVLGDEASQNNARPAGTASKPTANQRGIVGPSHHSKGLKEASRVGRCICANLSGFPFRVVVSCQERATEWRRSLWGCVCKARDKEGDRMECKPSLLSQELFFAPTRAPGYRIVLLGQLTQTVLPDRSWYVSPKESQLMQPNCPWSGWK